MRLTLADNEGAVDKDYLFRVFIRDTYTGRLVVVSAVRVLVDGMWLLLKVNPNLTHWYDSRRYKLLGTQGN